MTPFHKKPTTQTRKVATQILQGGAALLLLLTAVSASATDLIQPGNVTLNPANTDGSPVVLTLQGVAYDNPATPAPGLTLSYHDAATASGVFRLYRPAGQYQWQLSNADGSDRLAMQLDNNHALTIYDPADPTGATNAIVFTPGAGGGISYNNQPLAFASSVLPVNPAQLAIGAASTIGVGGMPNGFLAVGDNARANNSAFAVGPNSTATGTSSFAAGTYATASGYESFALGSGTQGMGSYSMALGNASAAAGAFSVAIGYGSAAWGNSSTSIGGGQATGVSSISLGSGASEGNESLSGPEGFAFADNSVAIGFGATTCFQGQIALGAYNAPGTPVSGFNNVPAATDLLFMIGNGVNPGGGAPIVCSNALAVAYNGNTEIQGSVTVDGGTPEAPATSVFKGDVNIEGVPRLAPAGDLSMGVFTAGAQP